MGTAGCNSVRAVINVSRCASVSAAHAAPASRRSTRMRSSARCARSESAVSTMSWLVAPRWTYGRASGDTAAVRSLTSGAAGLPAPTARRPIAGEVVALRQTCRRDLRCGRCRNEPGVRLGAGECRLHIEHRLQPGDVADGLIHARRCRRASPTSPSAVEEDGLTRALKVDVEPEATAVGRLQRESRVLPGSATAAPRRPHWPRPHRGSTAA